MEAHHHDHRRQEPQHRSRRPHPARLVRLVPGPRHAHLQEAGPARRLCRQVQRALPIDAEPHAEAEIEGDFVVSLPLCSVGGGRGTGGWIKRFSNIGTLLWHLSHITTHHIMTGAFWVSVFIVLFCFACVSCSGWGGWLGDEGERTDGRTDWTAEELEDAEGREVGLGFVAAAAAACLLARQRIHEHKIDDQ